MSDLFCVDFVHTSLLILQNNSYSSKRHFCKSSPYKRLISDLQMPDFFVNNSFSFFFFPHPSVQLKFNEYQWRLISCRFKCTYPRQFAASRSSSLSAGRVSRTPAIYSCTASSFYFFFFFKSLRPLFFFFFTVQLYWPVGWRGTMKRIFGTALRCRFD